MKLTVFGEILWDVFGDEKKIGGAPFNFAAHVTRLGHDARVVSAIGNDALGDAAIEEVKALNMDPSTIARVANPTGYCQVTLHNGTPSYDLVRGVAYDAIPVPEQSLFTADAFYFGTLAQRGEVSRQTLETLLTGSYREVFFDINIRQHYYSDEMIDFSLKHTTIFKISREEIGVMKMAGTPEEICPQIAQKYPNLKLIIVTLDCDGSLVYDCAQKTTLYSPKPASKVVSTVGAGDSFSACFIANYLSGADLPTCLKKATLLSDYVVTQLGAVPAYPDELMAAIKPE